MQKQSGALTSSREMILVEQMQTGAISIENCDALECC